MAELLTLDDVARRLGVSRRTAQRRIAESGITFARPGRSYVFTEADYDALCYAIRKRDFPLLPITLSECLEQHGLPVSNEPSGFIYFIESDGTIKIGWSKHPDLRIAELQTATSKPLNLLGHVPASRDLENALHRKFANSRVKGEWFKAGVDLREFVRHAVGCADCDRVRARTNV